MTVYLTLLGILAVTSILELLHIKLESKQKKNSLFCNGNSFSFGCRLKIRA